MKDEEYLFLKKQLTELLTKMSGAMNLIDSGSVILARNKMLGIKQKIGYIYNTFETIHNDSKEVKESEDNTIKND